MRLRLLQAAVIATEIVLVALELLIFAAGALARLE